MQDIILSCVSLLLLLILRMHNTEIEKRLPKGEFKEYKEATEKRLNRGSDRFDKVEKKADINGNRITQVETVIEERKRK